MSLPLRFHWHPSAFGCETSVLRGAFRCAETCGIESVLVTMESALEHGWATFLASEGGPQKIKLMAGCDDLAALSSGKIARQIGVLAQRLPGRILIHLPVDRLSRRVVDDAGEIAAQELSLRMREFLGACCTLPAPRPEIFLEGTSAEAAVLAIKFADCLWRPPQGLEAVRSDAM